MSDQRRWRGFLLTATLVTAAACFPTAVMASDNAVFDDLKDEVAKYLDIDDPNAKVEVNDDDYSGAFLNTFFVSGRITYSDGGSTVIQAFAAMVAAPGVFLSAGKIGAPQRSGGATSVSSGGGSSGSRAIHSSNAPIDAIVVGYMDNGPFTPYHAFRYDGGTDTLLDLGALGPASTTQSFARGVNRDGSVVVGISATSDPFVTHAFRWTEASGMVDLGAGPELETSSRAFAVSGDGSKIVGTRSFKEDELSFTQTKAFLCAYTTAPCSFQDLTDGVATAMTDDGSVIAGQRTLNNASTAFRWTSAGGVQNLGTLAGHSRSAATGISDNGKVVVGISSTVPISFDGLGVAYDEITSRAFRWTAATGLKNLNQLLVDAGVNLGGLTIVAVTSVSQDGQWITGAATNSETGPGETLPVLIHYCDAAIEGECLRRFDHLIAGDLDANPRDDLVLNRSIAGIFSLSNGTTWTNIHPNLSQGLAAGDFNGNGRDDLLVDFGAGGLWERYDNGTWTKIHPTSPLEIATARLDSNANEEAVVDFGTGGLWARFNNTTWTKLHPGAPEGLAKGDFDGNSVDDLLVDFGPGGLWARYSNTAWLKLHPTSPDDFLAARLDNNLKEEAVVDFGAGGLWSRFNNSSWTKLHTADADDLAAGDLNGNGRQDLLVDFGAGGLWARYDNGTWLKLHYTSPDAIVAADLDNSGKAEVVADFGAGGIWARYNDLSWVKLPALP